jgi:hypothetical protein
MATCWRRVAASRSRSGQEGIEVCHDLQLPDRWQLPNGNILVYNQNNYQVAEMDPKTNKVVRYKPDNNANNLYRAWRAEAAAQFSTSPALAFSFRNA